MNQTDPPLLEQRAVARSLTLQSAGAIAIAAVAGRFNVELAPGLAQDLAATVIDLITTLGLIGVAVGRTRARAPIA